MREVPLLQVKDLQVSFTVDKKPVPVVRGLSYSLPAGKVLAVVGESGSGKTVHALSLLKLLPPAAAVRCGEILYKGKNLLTLPDTELRQIRGQKISMIFQDPVASLNPVLTIGEQLIETLRAHRKITKQEAFAQAISLLEKVGIADAGKRLTEYPFQFSGGMCQRVMIAMALALSPDILIADEPTTALDVTIQAQIIRLIKKLQQSSGMSVIFITHNLALASQVADEVLVLYSGLCMEQASAADLFANPVHPYTRGLLASLPSVKTRSERLPAIAGTPPVAGEQLIGCPFAPRCPHAVEKCRHEIPPLTNRAGHQVRCFRRDNKI
ncbi:MAG: ABC transporter ATP-binding protein [Elusimicrobiaceae bacterium]|nr:ABC transporter ATP-binding protein [Elusimicrobiaceae bacterium]